VAFVRHERTLRSPARAAPDQAPATEAPSGEDTEAAAKRLRPILFGQVVEDATGAPFTGAAVTAYAFATRATSRATTAAGGSFAFPDAVGAFQIVARHEGLGSAAVVAVPSAEPVILRLSPGGGIRGRVISAENGAAIPACRVLAVRVQGWEEDQDVSEWLLLKLLPEELLIEAVATTRSNGEFEMAEVAPGFYMVLAHVEGQVLSAGSGVKVETGSTAEVEIRKPATAPFFLDVIDQDTGEPLDGARFEVFEVMCEGIAAPMPAQYRGDGVYELRSGYRNGLFHVLVRIRRDGYAPRCLFVHCGEGNHERAALGRGAAVAGHVRTSDGPLPQAFVFVVAWNTLVGTAVTGADGGFEINGLDAPEDVIVYALRPSLESIAELRFQLRDGERHVMEIGGAGGAAIEGRVILGGAPVADTWVTLWGPCDSNTQTDPDGAYAFEGLDPGRYHVTFDTDGQTFEQEVDVERGKRARLDFDAPCLLSGMVVDAGTGAPVADREHLEVIVSSTSGDHVTDAKLGDDGRFRLWVAPGFYEIHCESPDVHGLEGPRVDLTREAESGPVTLRVERDPQDGRIVLDVKDARTGDPVSKGHWGLEPLPWIASKKLAGARIEVKELSLGLHRLTVWSDEHAPTTVEITLTPQRKDVRQTVLLEPSEAVRVGYIQRGAPEAIAGLRRGDVILSFPSVAAMEAALASARGAVAIEIERDGERKTITLPSGEIEASLENTLLGR